LPLWAIRRSVRRIRGQTGYSCRARTVILSALLLTLAGEQRCLSACKAYPGCDHYRMGRKKLVRRFGMALLVIGVAIGVLWVVGLVWHKGLDWAAKSSEVLSFLVVVAGLLAAWFGWIRRWARGPQPPTPEEIDKARIHLHAALAGMWSEKGSEVYESRPMRVRFARPTEAVDSQNPHDTARADAPTVEQSTSRLPRCSGRTRHGHAVGQSQASDGDFDSVADAFSREPRYRRVVLGEAGAGKTVLVTELQRKLVEAPRPGDPLPVIVPAGAWEPDKQSLLDWLAKRLKDDYGWLPEAHARALVARGMVLPILDGLDEMPTSLQPVAIARINKHYVHRPLVVTSREEDYREAADLNHAGVKGSVVVEVQPLRAADTRSYLDPTGSGGWDEVLGDNAHGGELASVLTNPLMLWLARVEYEGKSPDNLTLFGSRKSVRHHLIDEFVPAVYADDSGLPAAGQFRCNAQQAKCWLGHLGAAGLAWWQIGYVAGKWRQLGRALRAAVLCSVAAILGIWVLERHGNWRHGAYSGPVNLGDLLLGGPVGRHIRPAIRTLTMNIKGPALRDLTSVSHVIDGIFSHTFVLVLAAALFVIGAAVTVGSPRLPTRLQFRVRGVLRGLIRCCVLFVLAALGALLLLYATHWPVSAAVFFGSRSTWIALVAVSLLGLISIPKSFIVPSETSGNVSPDVSLRLDRQADLVVTVSRRSAVAVAVWLFCGAQIAFAYAIYAITATVVAVVLGGQNTFASRVYTDARIWLTAQGRAPWRTMGFLADANRRGVLRQVGAAYQFRHSRLLERADNWQSGPSRLDVWKSRLGELTNAARERVRWRREETPGRVGEDGSRRWWSAQAGPDAVLPEFAKDLDDLAGTRWWSDERARAAALGDLLDDYQTLAETDPALKPGLARALKDSASEFSWDEGLGVARKAVDCYRELAQTDPAAFLPGLAEAVSHLAARLGKLDRLEEARCLTTDIVETARRRAEADPATFLPVLAYSLNDLSRWLWVSQVKESVSAQAEAAAIYLELTEADPARFALSLTSSLARWASMFKALGWRREELTAIRYRFDAYWKRAECIAAIRRQIAESELAILLQGRQEPTTGRQLFGGARSEGHKKALAAARRAAVIFGKKAESQKLAESQPAEVLPDLAEAANGLAAELKSACKRREAQILAGEIAEIRRQLAESELAILLQGRQEPTSGKQLFGRARSERHKKALAAARRAAVIFGKLAESQPEGVLPDLAEAANGLAAELKSAGKRREAQILAGEADRIRSQYRRSVDVTYRGGWEVRPLDAMDALALELWELGKRIDAVAFGQISRDLAPATRAGAAATTLWGTSLARLLSRIREEREVRWWSGRARSLKNSIRLLQQKAQRDPGAWADLADAQQKLVEALVQQWDALGTLVFRRLVADRKGDAEAARRQAQNVRQEALPIYREMRSNRLPSDRSDLPKSSGTLALRLQESGSGGSDGRSQRDQRDTPVVLASIPQPAPAVSARSGDPPKAVRTD
jgi:NACHT domain